MIPNRIGFVSADMGSGARVSAPVEVEESDWVLYCGKWQWDGFSWIYRRLKHRNGNMDHLMYRHDTNRIAFASFIQCL